MPNLPDHEVAIAAATAGAAELRAAYGGDLTRIAKSATDFATTADLASERAIMSVLSAHRPLDDREGEETGLSGAGAERRWLVDPLCGTVNFAAATPLACVNVALVAGADVLAAAVADPFTGEVFWTDGSRAMVRAVADSSAGLGAGDSPLRPSRDSGIVDVNADGPLDRPFVGAGLVADPALRAAWAPRVLSTTLAVAWVASGRRAAYVSDGDLAGSVHFTAGIAICAASGAVVTDLAGAPVHTGPGLIVAADEQTHSAMVALVGPHLTAITRHPS